MKGFNAEDGIRLLDKWVRTSLIKTSRIGRAKDRGEQIAYVRPLSFLTYKPTLPTQSSRLRQVHSFIYNLCRDHVRRKYSNTVKKADFEEIVRRTFAKGVAMDDSGRDKKGSYDGHTELDLEVLLQLYYLDGFPAPDESNAEPKKLIEPACFQASSSIARHFVNFMEVYSPPLIPPAILARYLVCLLNFELLIYTLRLAKATNRLVTEGETPPEFERLSAEYTPLEIYVDLTQIRGSKSDTLANACVNRDLEDWESLFRSSLTLRTLDRYMNRNLKNQLDGKEGGEYILALYALRNEPSVQARAEAEIDKIRSQNIYGEDEILPLEIKSIIDDLTKDELSCIVELLVQGQRQNGMKNLIAWYRDTGGLHRTDGILRGNVKGRRVWRYVMSDILLETLVQLAAVDSKVRSRSGTNIGNNTLEPDSITLEAFLQFLEERFGLLIDRPPSFDCTVEATSAAKENFSALKQRLRQMGLFLDLSDDFNAQRIFPRFCKVSGQPDNTTRLSVATFTEGRKV